MKLMPSVLSKLKALCGARPTPGEESTAEGSRTETLQAELPPPAEIPTPNGPRRWQTHLPEDFLTGLERGRLAFSWRGVSLPKSPFDLALYPRLLWSLKPLTIIEVGSKLGAAALWLGDLLNNFGINANVYSLDAARVADRAHPRVTFLEGDGRSLERVLEPGFLECLPRPWLVIAAGEPSFEAASAVLRFFHPWLQAGEYVVVENSGGSTAAPAAAAEPGPHRAIREFLAQNPGQYEIDVGYCDFFGYNATSCANGWLKKVGAVEPLRAGAELEGIKGFMDAGQYDRAVACISQIKSLRVPVRGLDLLRARCFVQMKREAEAIEALQEALRWHADDAEAAALLQQLTARQPAPELPDDTEFRELFALVQPYTMLSVPRLYSLYTQAKAVCGEDLPGNIVECGVAAGGASALLAAVVARHSQRPRKVFSCDSFEGLPNPSTFDRHGGKPAAALGWGGGTCAAPMDSLLEIAAKVKAGEVVVPVRGFFAQSLPVARNRIGPIALLHLDGDWYESTMSILDNLYAQVVEGGWLQIDDYGHWEGCRRAVEDFEKRSGLKFQLEPVDPVGVRFKKQVGS